MELSRTRKKTPIREITTFLSPTTDRFDIKTYPRHAPHFNDVRKKSLHNDSLRSAASSLNMLSVMIAPTDKKTRVKKKQLTTLDENGVENER